MSSQNAGDTSRKPSGSSTHSGGHSPSASPNNVCSPLFLFSSCAVNIINYFCIQHSNSLQAHSQRKLAPGSAGNIFGVNGTGGLKGLNSNWPVRIFGFF